SSSRDGAWITPASQRKACWGPRCPVSTNMLRYCDQCEQRVVQFIGIAHIGPGFTLDLGDGLLVESTDFFQHRGGKNAAHFDGAGAALFQWGIVEIGIWVGIQDFVREDARDRRID